MIDLRHLRYAVAADRHGSFRKAAIVLGVRQSSLSRRVHELEDLAGLAIFDRSYSGAKPTPDGEAFLRTARHIVDETDMLSASKHNRKPGTFGRLVIGCYCSLSAGNLRATLIEYNSRFPMVSVMMASGSRNSLLADVASGSIDCAVVTAGGMHWDGAMLPLWTERVVIALPDTHALKDQAVIYWSELKGERFLMSRLDPGPELERLLGKQLAHAGHQPHITRHDINGLQLPPLVSAGLGISLDCESSLGTHLDGVVYRELRNGGGASRLDYACMWRLGKTDPPLASFLALLRERYPEIPGASDGSLS